MPDHDIAVSVRGLSKSYTIAHNPAKHTRITEALFDTLKNIRRPPEKETFWALRDVECDIKKGDVVGIIGRNGAGKSTLLKILSRITEPTTGQIDIYGRVGSLLEVGTGFHPELTGRENIYMNGAILGMSKREITKHFDDIVAFAEVEQFLDTPVKRYSSGMYVRLAFAVAAHLNPEILIVDEVLAVGDASFQKKCLGKMQDVSRQEGRTVLFVSHNMAAVTRLCDKTILLNHGQMLDYGRSSEVIGSYLKSGIGTTANREWHDLDRAPGNDVVRIRSVRVCTEEGQTTDSIDIRKPVGIEMIYDVLRPGYALVANHHFFNGDGVCVFVLHDNDPEWRRKTRPVGTYESKVWIPGNFLAEGTLIMGAAISSHDPVVVHAHEPDAIAFEVIDSLDGDSARGDYAGPMPGAVRPLLRWTNRMLSSDGLPTETPFKSNLLEVVV